MSSSDPRKPNHTSIVQEDEGPPLKNIQGSDQFSPPKHLGVHERNSCLSEFNKLNGNVSPGKDDTPQKRSQKILSNFRCALPAAERPYLIRDPRSRNADLE